MDSKSIQLEIGPGEQVEIKLFPIRDDLPTLWKIEDCDAQENGEAVLQVLEGFLYEYTISEGYKLPKINKLVIPSKAASSTGRIEPGLYVGTLKIPVLDNKDDEVAQLEVEVRSIKASYRDDYRFMLEEIADQCTSLILKSSSPALQKLGFDFKTDAETNYQLFAFIQSVISSPEFDQAIQRILAQPISNWRATQAKRDIRNLRRLSGNDLRKLTSGQNRYPLPKRHPLKARINSLPSHIESRQIIQDLDTPENRFVKFALTEFLRLCTAVKKQFESSGPQYSRATKEALALEEYLGDILGRTFFRNLSYPETLPLNSPVLQRKDGYRYLLRIWLLFDVAARLVWSGGEDVYNAGKRDVARLYEYWLFFILKDLIEEVFSLPQANLENLFIPTENGLDLKLKAGKQTVISGIFDNPFRRLLVEFSYNRSFAGNQEHPQAGSWTRQMRPDYTLSLWPADISKQVSEQQELITHIHFDAKYRIRNISEILGEEIEKQESDSNDEIGSNYQRDDLLKMHAYKDAIRRTAGAYVLYPGEGNGDVLRGFHEILPGLGAFAVRPSANNNGTDALRKFLEEVVGHIINRAAQREQWTYHTYDIFKGKSTEIIKEPLPEFNAGERSKPPQETYVLIGYCKNEEHYRWIKKTGLYNFRLTGRGAITKYVDPQMLNADYLLLHWKDHQITGDIYRINKDDHLGPIRIEKEQLIEKSYPNPGHEDYLVFEIYQDIVTHFEDIKWNVSNLNEFKERNLGFPIAISLFDLMAVKI